VYPAVRRANKGVPICVVAAHLGLKGSQDHLGNVLGNVYEGAIKSPNSNRFLAHPLISSVIHSFILKILTNPSISPCEARISSQ
jgi:hypothetical protein